MVLSLDMPDVEKWRRVRGILHQALSLAPEQRGAFLDQACGPDAALRAEVESLLEASEKPAVIDRPILASAAPTITIESPEASSLLKPGQMVSHYRIVEKIGEGGMGEVYKAIDKHLGRTVALKVILDGGADWKQRLRFAREAKAASALNHPNIVTIYEFNSADGIDFIAMEYVEGVTLDKLQHQPLPKLLGYARQAAGAFAKAHAAGILHRDLKPSNMMVSADGAVKILDFGLAKHQESPDLDATKSLALTRTGALVGTPAYMSPEQVLGERVGPAADIFSFGVILYELACGERPFKAKTALATLDQVAHYDPPISGDSVPPELAALIRRCLKKPPSERPQSFAEIAQALKSIVESIPGTGGDLAISSRRRWRIPAFVGLGAGLAGVLGVGLLVTHRLAPPPPALAYSIEAQKPGGEPYTASPSDTFQGGWRFRLRVTPPGSGFLYVVNQGPGQNGTERFWILDHVPAQPGQAVLTRWYDFDENPGSERVWLVWSRQPLSQIEDALRDSADGSVRSPGAAGALEELLAGLKGHPQGILGQPLELKHQ